MSREIDALQGSWTITALENDGAEMPSSAFIGAGITIDGDRFTSTGMGGTYEGTVVIDETKKPKTLDLIFTHGHAAGTRNVGIYTLDGGRWTICLATRGNRRPRAFATRPDMGLALETLERAITSGSANRKRRSGAKGKVGASPASVHASSPALRTSKPPTGATTAWEGEWAMVSGIFNGVPMAESMVTWVKRVTRGDVTEVVAGPQTMLRARFTLDDARHPHVVEYTNLAGPNKGKAQTGIADMTGDTLRICMAAPGRPRPDGFSSTPGDGRSFTTWRFVKK
jgi:uncharacterized protein (TIGR03067 family)